MRWTWLVSLAVVLVLPRVAQAYIGPGAGFAAAGSLLVMFTAVLSGLAAMILWPVRLVIRLVLGRHALARSRVKRFVILGLDGMDPRLAERFMAEGKLPNLSALSEQGCFKRLATTTPSISPVAWSSFQTGVNPGKHNIFDFLTRDLRTYRPLLSSVEIRPPRRSISIGKFQFALGKPDIRLLRKSKPFWKVLGEHGIFSNIIRVPITFPPEKFRGVQLSGMCVPDLRGSQGMFSFYTTRRTDDLQDHTGGQQFVVPRNGDSISAKLIGAPNPMRKDGRVLELPFSVKIQDAETVRLKVNGKVHQLKCGVYSDWVQIAFKAAPGVKVRGICKFLLLESQPELRLYVTPINIDPDNPAMPISYPAVYAKYLAKRQGPFATLGLAEDSWALNEKILREEDFLQQCLDTDQEREVMFFDALDKVRHGLVVCVFDGTDRIQHTFWSQIDDEHPTHDKQAAGDGPTIIEQLYLRMDDLVGRTVKQCDDDDTVLMVISDHGFSTFRYGVDLNRWLQREGYLTVKDEQSKAKNLENVDWSNTRAYAVGLAGIFLNLKGREAQGIVESNGEASDLRKEISKKLTALVDPVRNAPAVNAVHNALEIFDGPYKADAPDLIVGYHRGYRAAWETAIGQVTDEVFHVNTKAWSGDHCIDPSLVPGVLFSNRSIDAAQPRLMDMGPTVLNMFGVDVPLYMDGKPLKVADAGVGDSVSDNQSEGQTE